MQKVISLEPRTPHQPGKLQKLSKNEFVLLLLVLESIKTAQLYLLSVQSSAAGSQGGEQKIVQPEKALGGNPHFSRQSIRGRLAHPTGPQRANCENHGEYGYGRGFSRVRKSLATNYSSDFVSSTVFESV